MDLILLLIGLLLILGTGFFVAVEFSSWHSEPQPCSRQRTPAIKQPTPSCLPQTLSTQLSSCQIGITITTLLTGYTLDAAIKALTTGAISSLGLPTSVTDVLTLVLAMLIATLLSIGRRRTAAQGLAIAEPYDVARRVAPAQLAFTASCPRSCAS